MPQYYFIFRAKQRCTKMPAHFVNPVIAVSLQSSLQKQRKTIACLHPLQFHLIKRTESRIRLVQKHPFISQLYNSCIIALVSAKRVQNLSLFAPSTISFERAARQILYVTHIQFTEVFHFFHRIKLAPNYAQVTQQNQYRCIFTVKLS